MHPTRRARCFALTLMALLGQAARAEVAKPAGPPGPVPKAESLLGKDLDYKRVIA